MSYVHKNYEMLTYLTDYLKAFPFNEETTEKMKRLDLEMIKQIYNPFMETDNVANAIYWNADTLQALLEGESFRAFDEVVSFSETTLRKNAD